MESAAKAAYSAPILVELGTFEEITRGSRKGPNTDYFGSRNKLVFGS